MGEEEKDPKACYQLSSATNAYELLEEVKEVIKVDPLRYDQKIWLAREGYVEFVSRKARQTAPACGTIGCVAGWVMALTTSEYDGDTQGYAAKILGLDSEQTVELFHGGAAGDTIPQTPSHVDAGIRHITRFQEKYEKQLKNKKIDIPEDPSHGS